MYKPTSSPAIDYLKQFPNWVCWKQTATKVPVNPKTGGNAMPNLASTWGTYEQAVRRYKQSRDLKGLGFMFSKDLGIVGIDLDDKPNPVFFDGQLTKWASEIVASVNSYAELSPSGNGLHILTFGEIPHAIGSKDEHGVEMYDCVRWFTITGKHLPFTPNTIEERQDKITAIHSQYTTRKEYTPKPYNPDIDLSNISNERIKQYVNGVIRNVCSDISTAVDGAKHHTRFRSSASLGDLVTANWCELDYNTAFNVLMNSSMSNTTLPYDVVAKTIHDGIKKGMVTPRPLPEGLNKPLEPVVPPPQPSKPEVVVITQDELQKRLDDEYWRGYHDGMTEQQRQSWLQTGIPDSALDYIVDNFKLGFRPETIDNDTGEVRTDCLSIPYFTGDDTSNIEYRCLDSGLVTYELERPVIYNTTNKVPANHVCLLDDSIDSIKAWLQFGTVELGGDRLHFMALPKARLSINSLDVLNDASYIYVVASKHTDLKGRGLELLKSDARFVRLPMSISKTCQHVTGSEFISLLRNGEKW